MAKNSVTIEYSESLTTLIKSQYSVNHEIKIVNNGMDTE
jgi:hypothetical protein